jgi:endonuclease YncB( thermonuclease family)
MGNSLWLWNPKTDFAIVKSHLKLESNLKVVKKGRAPYPYLKIRFEAMDTPETHFNGGIGTAGAVVKQNYSYLARDALFQLLGDAFEGVLEGPQVRLECRMIKGTRYYDSYKRVIGQLYLNGQTESINMQMIESGYAFPMFYETMDANSIREFRERAQHAYDRDAGVWREYTMRPVDGSSPISGNETKEINDWGDVNYPKFWRRWVSYNYDPEGRPFQTFVDWLAQKGDDLLAKGSKKTRFSLAVSAHDNRLKAMPWDLIFRDK